ncbi:tetratricopeptide repeat protein [Streptomyces sp. NBC_00568]|uniref:tetratricopeptide repeat protein n=1 Tax=Streptomyces sp. NBC_00568 TaxID=2975779 RepID=UPI002252EE0F|nr:tetratricopeptide repeat protein [Streptomyces sp. NBC_00568]MCX4993530.1 tetratricopeptide repeat protein [Streptomyces sp. NBC_00568]
MALGAVAAVVALLESKEMPSWLAWCPPWLVVAVAAAVGAAGAWWAESWVARRQAYAEAEQQTVDRLRRHVGRQEGLVRIGDRGARARDLRVHEAISLPRRDDGWDTAGATARAARGGGVLARLRRRERLRRVGLDPDLPVFVEREAGEQVRAWMRTAARDGGALVLVGGSCVGKSRLLYESARRELSDFAVLAPDLGDGGLVNAVADATFELPHTVVWLDELQRFLPGPYFVADDESGHAPLTASALRKLLSADTPVVVLGTLWPEYAAELRAAEPVREGTPGVPRHQRAVDILSAAGVTMIALESFSERERARADGQAARDPRIARAMDDPDYNVTEVLAGAPQLIRRYEQSTRLHKAVVEAAVDARRLGVHGPLAPDLLRAVARELTAEILPDDHWFDSAVAELASRDRPADRATAPLIALVSTDRRAIRGYTVADYLLQHLTRQRRNRRLPLGAWQVLIDGTNAPEDRMRLARAAHHRLLYRTAESVYGPLADGDTDAAAALSELLILRGEYEEAQRLVESRVRPAGVERVRELGKRLVAIGRAREALPVFRCVADDDHWAAYELAKTLEGLDDTEELWARAVGGDAWAAVTLGRLLHRRGDRDEALRAARLGVDAHSDPYITGWVAGLLVDLGEVDEALRIVRMPEVAVTSSVEDARAELLRARGDAEELRSLADSGDSSAEHALLTLLTFDPSEEVLRTYVAAGHSDAACALSQLLVREGKYQEAIEVLRPFWRDDPRVATELGTLLARYLPYEEYAEAVAVLRSALHAGDPLTRHELYELLSEHPGSPEHRRMLRQYVWNRRRSSLARLFRFFRRPKEEVNRWVLDGPRYREERVASFGTFQGLRAAAKAGDPYAAVAVALRLQWLGRPGEGVKLLRATPPHPCVTRELAELLVETGRPQEAVTLLEPLADSGDERAAHRMAKLLGALEDAETLRSRAARDDFAEIQLVELEARTGDKARLREDVDGGDWLSTTVLLESLVEQGDVDLLYDEVHAGTSGAGAALIGVLDGRGEHEAAERLRTVGCEAEDDTDEAGSEVVVDS